jgi:hypothetical protein
MAEGEEAETVLLYACCGIRRRKVKGAGGGGQDVSVKKTGAQSVMNVHWSFQSHFSACTSNLQHTVQ